MPIDTDTDTERAASETVKSSPAEHRPHYILPIPGFGFICAA